MANSIENANRAAGERVPAHSIDGTGDNDAVINLMTPTKSTKQGCRVFQDKTNTPQGSGSTNRDVAVSKLDPPGKRGARKPAHDTNGSSSRRDSKPVKGTRRKQRGQRTAASTGHTPAENNGHRIRKAPNDSSVPSCPASMGQSSTRTNHPKMEERINRKRREVYARNMGRAPHDSDVSSNPVSMNDQSSTRTNRSEMKELLDHKRRERMDAANTERAPAEKNNNRARKAPDSSSMRSGQVSNRARKPVEREREPRAAVNTGNAPAENNSHRIREPTPASDDDSVSSDQAVCSSGARTSSQIISEAFESVRRMDKKTSTTCRGEHVPIAPPATRVRGSFAAEFLLSRVNKYDERQKKMYERARCRAHEAFTMSEVEWQKRKIEQMEMRVERLMSENKGLKTQIERLERLTSENKALKTSFDKLKQNCKRNRISSQLEP